jgi:hypothetical protein
MKPLFKFGTYGFLCVMMASQLASASTAEKMDRKLLDAKKSGRETKRSLKKSGRKITGDESYAKDAKDVVKDGYSNTKDEVKHAKKHHFDTKKAE